MDETHSADRRPPPAPDGTPPKITRHTGAIVTDLAPGEGRAYPDVPGYEILGILGHGGMGVVYRARQLQANRLVALKMIRAVEHASPTERLRFQIETEAVARLQHPHIVQLYEAGEVRGQPFVSLEFCDGGTLTEQLQKQRPSPREAAGLIETLARAMHYAHLRGVVHRDLKPGNVLLVPCGGVSSPIGPIRPIGPIGEDNWIPKITDFGLAKRIDAEARDVSQSGAIMGTAAYMAPEQAAGKVRDTGPAADVYALGALLYECLTGRPPFAGPQHEVLLRVLSEEPVPPSRVAGKVPRDLETICLKCLEKEPSRRYRSAEALADDLKRWEHGEPIAARPATAWDRLSKWCRRRPAAAALLGVSLGAALIILGLAGLLYHHELERARAETRRQTDEVEKERRARAAVETEREQKIAQLEQSQRTLMTSQILRAAAVWQRDPILARELLEDANACPVALRDFPWRYYHRLSRCEYRPLRGHETFVLALAVSPDSKLLASGDADGTIRLWDLRSGEVLHVLRGHQKAVNGLAFSPDGQTLYSGAADAAVKVWSIRDGKEQQCWNGGDGPIHALALSPDGKTLATAGSVTFFTGGQIRLWDVATGRSRKLGERLQSAYVCVAFSPDGKLLAGGCTMGAQADVWDLDGTAPPATTQLMGMGWVQGVVFSNDARWLMIGRADDTLRLCEVTRTPDHGTPRILEQVVRHGQRDQVEAVALHPSRTILASTGFSQDVGVRLWDLPTLQERTVLRARPQLHEGGGVPTHPVCFTPDGKILVQGGDRVIRRWAIPSDGGGVTLPHQQVLALGLSPNGKILATGGEWGDVKLWDLQTGRLLATRQLIGAVHALAFAPDNRCLAVATGTSPRNEAAEQLHLFWDFQDETALTLFGVVPDQPAGAPPLVPKQCRGLLWSKDGRSLAWLDSRQLCFHDVDTETRSARLRATYLRRPPTAEFFSVLAISKPGVALVADASGQVLSVDAVHGEETAIRELGHDLTAVTLSRDENLLAVSLGSAPESGRAVKVFDLRRNPNAAPTLLQVPNARITALAFSPDGRSLAGAEDTLVRVWDLASGQSRSLLRGHSDTVTALTFDRNGQMLVSGAAYLKDLQWAVSGEVKFWVAEPDQAGSPESLLPEDPWWNLERENVRVAALKRRGRNLANTGDRQAAVAIFQEALNLDPTDPALWMDRARALYRLGRYREAADDFGKLLQLQPGDLETVLFHAGCLVLAGDEEGYRRACRDLRARRGWNPDRGGDAYTVRIHALGGTPKEAAEQARAQMKQIVDRSPQVQQYRHALAWATYRAGHYDEALTEFNDLLKANPAEEPINVLYWLGLALAHHRVGRPGQGQPWLDRARAWMATAVQELPPDAAAPQGIHPYYWLECQVYLREAELLYQR